MNGYLFGLIIILSLHLGHIEINNQEAARQVCWIENAGFFIDLPDGDILIDAVLSSSDELAEARPPFDDVRLIFVSHVHGDHFNAHGILSHLNANKKAHVILTPESFDMLQRLDMYKSVEDRISVFFPEADQMEAFKINGFSGDVLQFKHAGVQNIGLGLSGKQIDLVYLNGGFQKKELATAFSSKYPENDIVIANKWPLSNVDYVNKINELYNPKLLLLAHHSGANDEIVKRNGGVSEMQKRMSVQKMKGIVFENRMQCEQF